MQNKTITGILNINKPAGITSHDVVSRVRKLTGTRKVGHTGTLDPMATGVLLVCVGNATRLIEYMMPGHKRYQATLRLGQSTNTYDADGEIVATADPSAVTEADLQAALAQFVGEIQQTPPPFSAIKKNGVPLYKLARRGETVLPEPRTVHIESIDLLTFTPPTAVIDVRCHAGTYIRSIAHDVGQALGVGAHLSQLTRVANSNWCIDEAVSLDELAAAAESGSLAQHLHPIEDALAYLPQVCLSMAETQKICMGQTIEVETLPAATTDVAALDGDDKLVAIVMPQPPNLLKPRKVFRDPISDTQP